jgi:N-acetylglucosaminyldiphosphoundecaprenol N-acetyl-beta-D-mannosaminyltransferase
MLARLHESDSRVFLLGGTEDEVQGTRQRIQARFPGLRVVGVRSGYFNVCGKENDAILQTIEKARPNVLLVAMGFPRQEEWIAENMPHLRVNVVVAEGGSFSFISGATPRAPRWLRRMGLEWLYRLAREPRRLRRQLAIPRFLWLVAGKRLRAARGG